MNKFERLLKVLRLICRTYGATTKEICATCSICERTAFRYVRNLRETGFAIKFNQKTRSYCLNQVEAQLFDNLSINDWFLTIVALKITLNISRDSYRADLENVLTKLLLKFPLSVRELVMTPITPPLQPISESISNNLMSALILDTAVVMRKKIRIKFDGISESNELEIQQPILKFENDWCLDDALKLDEQLPVRLKSITRVIVLTE